LIDGADMAQGLVGLGMGGLRRHLDIQPLQSVRDGPAEQRAVTWRSTRYNQPRQQCQEAILITGFNDDQRNPRLKYQSKIVHITSKPGATD
jgi:hypothetical protein